jgi:osmotically inducible lipoprotein OsmB
MKKYLVLLLAVLMFVGACGGYGGGGDATLQRTLGGGALGAASGALIGAGTGNPAAGAAIGGGAGLIGGYLYDQYEKNRYGYGY